MMEGNLLYLKSTDLMEILSKNMLTETRKTLTNSLA